MEEDCIGGHGPQRTVVPEKKKKKKSHSQISLY
jgi:hypothetical protein